MIVEDDSSIRDFLVEALNIETPYRSMPVADAWQASEALQTQIPDLVLLDYRLPGMDGLAFYDCLQEKDELKHIPVLIMSVNAPIQELKKRKIASIRKPFSLDDFLQKIEEILAA